MQYVYYLLGFLSVLLYLQGFFPFSNKIKVKSSDEDPQGAKTNPVQSKYDKVVLMIIDALRVDFVDPKFTPKMWKTMTQNGCLMTIKAETPTVTMPRIKALTTGSVPEFVDIILSIVHVSALDDSLIHRANKKHKRIVFYGDNTWVKLFPHLFSRYEGTTSFYVNDFEEVDNNVTRNVKLELDRMHNWDIMILHYLGLDHIGHVLGPRVSQISVKLLEMDDIFHEISTKLSENHRERTLILVTGDHGMKDSGGHGGSTQAETTVPLVVIGMDCTNDTFSQIDIPANLAILLGLDIPRTSIGQLRSSLLSQLSLDEYLDALKYNNELLREKLDLCGNSHFKAAVQFHESFKTNDNREIGEEARRLYEKCSKNISDTIRGTSTKQDIHSLVITMMTCLWLLLKMTFLRSYSILDQFEAAFVLFILIHQLFHFNRSFTWALTGFLGVVLLKNGVFALSHVKTSLFYSKNYDFPLLITVLGPMTFFSTSYIEEEHQFWYFSMNLFLSINALSCCDRKQFKSALLCVLIMICVRILRTLNQIGDQWASETDTSDWLLKQHNYYYWQVVFILGLLLNASSLLLLENRNKKSNCIINSFILVLIYVFRTFADEGATWGKLIWFCMLLKMMYCTTSKSFSLASLWVLIITLLLKPHNVILISVCNFTSHFFHKKLLENHRTIILAHLWLGIMFYFMQGHCNSLGSVDVSSGYVGLNDYQPGVVVIQTLIHTYAFPILSHLLLFKNDQIDKTESFFIFFLHRLYTISTVFFLTFMQRYHLFIWSVFAPKLFVEASHFCILFIEITCFYIVSLLRNKKII